MAETVRCAIYTRKSSEEGLDQAFNSLHAQREACEAYILSQKHEGWTLLPQVYDDGGHSGGTLKRPALEALRAAVEAGEVDTIVVYKVDRLTRSLADFAKLVEQFDRKKVSFVSVTQAFNTTTSMGRLTLNVLLSFAQFEREVTGERIRDKIAASKAKGMWMGGRPPLGYAPVERTLVINHAEAAKVRTLFEDYLACGSVDELVKIAAAKGIHSKSWTTAKGIVTGGGPLCRGALYHILSNETYLGKIVHRGAAYAAKHESIISEALFGKVKAQLEAQRRKRGSHGRSAERSPLAGLVYVEGGQRLGTTHTLRRGHRYRYYAAKDKGGTRIPAELLEAAVRKNLIETLASKSKLSALIAHFDGSLSSRLEAGQALAGTIRKHASLQRDLCLGILSRVVIAEGSLTIELVSAALNLPPQAGSLAITVPNDLAVRTENLAVLARAPAKKKTSPAVLVLLAQARTWLDELVHGKGASIASIASRERVTASYIGTILNLAFVDTAVVDRLFSGEDVFCGSSTDLKQLVPLPLRWEEQQPALAAALLRGPCPASLNPERHYGVQRHVV